MSALYRNTVVQLSPGVLDLVPETDALDAFGFTTLDPDPDVHRCSSVWLAKASYLERKIKEGFPAIEMVKDNDSSSLKVFGLWDELSCVLKVLEYHHSCQTAKTDLEFGCPVFMEQTTQTSETDQEFTVQEVTVVELEPTAGRTPSRRSRRLSSKYKIPPPEPHRTRSRAKKAATTEKVNTVQVRAMDFESTASPIADSQTMTDVLSAIAAVENIGDVNVKKEGAEDNDEGMTFDTSALDELEESKSLRIRTSFLKDHYSVNVVGKKSDYACKHCEHTCRELKLMREHLLRKHLEKRFKCTMCEKAFGIKRDLTRHLLVHRCDMTCTQKDCTFRCSKKREMKEHILKSHLWNAKPEFACPNDNCNYQASTEKNLNNHVKRLHGEKTFECTTCCKKFAMKKDLTNHMAYHLRRYACYICDKILCSKTTLQLHIKNVHHKMGIRTNKTCLCSVCGKLCHNRTFMQAHMNKAHLNIRPHKCTQCNKSFYSQVQCRRHMVSHSDVRKHICSICNKSFKLRRALKIHSVIHMDSRPFKCEQCGKTFTQSGALTRHSRIHSGERPYSCGTCKQSFSDSSILRRHLLKKHMQPPQMPAPEPVLETIPYTKTIDEILNGENIQIKIEQISEASKNDSSSLDKVNIILEAAQQSFLADDQEQQQLQPQMLPTQSVAAASLPQLLQTGGLITLADGRQGCIIQQIGGHSLVQADSSELQNLLTMSAVTTSEQMQEHPSYSM